MSATSQVLLSVLALQQPQACSAQPFETRVGFDDVKVFIVDLPAELNHGLVRRAIELHTNGSLSNPGSSFLNIINFGLGPNLSDAEWHNTHQFNLEMILHQKLLSHRYRTLDPFNADIFWIPYYPAFGAFFSVDPGSERASQVKYHENKVLAWLKNNAPKYHTERWRYVMSLGCVSHQFLVPPQENWGSDLLSAKELMGINIVGIESVPGCSDVCWNSAIEACTRRCHGSNGRLNVNTPLIGVPYPSFFHALRKEGASGTVPWASSATRNILATFIGEAVHGQVAMPLRMSIVASCRTRPKDCFVASANKFRGQLESIIEAYQRSIFCLQPPGDTATRRGIFDAIMCGCIPVLFSPDQLGGTEGAPLQYPFHLPHPEELSVLVPTESQNDIIGYLSLVAQNKDRIQMLQSMLSRAAPVLQYSHPKDACQSGSSTISTSACEPDALDVLLLSLARKTREYARV
jgi:hypothetical protein